MSEISHPADDTTGIETRSTRDQVIRWFYLFFFISGFCSLVYEVVWLRLVVAQFGVTTPMVSIMLSVFMAGLGLGSWGGGKLAQRLRNREATVALRLYAGLELVIGLSALIVPMLLKVGYNLLKEIGSHLSWGSVLFYLVSGLWVGLALLPWCTAMGATFPFAMAAIGQLSAGASERSFSYLYLANVLGALAGTLIPAFLLIEFLGFRGTLRVASICNLLLAAAVFLFSLVVKTRTTRGEKDSGSRPYDIAPVESSILAQLFTTGLCSMALEVIWIRQFTVYLGNVVYAFAVILGLYLAATFTGAAYYRHWARSKMSPRDLARLAWILLGSASMLPLLAADPRLPIPESAYVIGSLLTGAVRTAIGIVPFSFLVGFLTPMLVDRWSGGVPDRAGHAYATNVLGSILGPLVAGFLIVPFAGERWGLLLVAVPLFAIGLAAAQRGQSRAVWGVAAITSMVLLAFGRDYSLKYPNHVELRDYTATVLASTEGKRKRLLVNGTGMTKLTPITKMMAHLPFAFHQGPVKKGLVICMGMGTTFRSMLSWGIDATVVELVPSVPKLFPYFHPDAPQLLATGRGHIVVDDGRRFLERSSEKFDVMAIDPPPPIGAPTSSLLYSLEFYATVKPHIKPDSILQIWCPGGDSRTQAAITKAIQQSFRYVRAFESLEHWGTHYIVSETAIPDPDLDSVIARMPEAAKRDIVEFNKDSSTPKDMFLGVVNEEYDVQQIANLDPTAPPITDNRAINEYFLVRSLQP